MGEIFSDIPFIVVSLGSVCFCIFSFYMVLGARKDYLRERDKTRAMKQAWDDRIAWEEHRIAEASAIRQVEQDARDRADWARVYPDVPFPEC